jgi:hypothetical protein
LYPLDVLPHWMQVVALGLPPGDVVQNLRSLVKEARSAGER